MKKNGVELTNSVQWSTASSIFNLVTQLVQISVIGRLLGPHEMGIFASLMVIVGFATVISDMGLGNYLVQESLISKNLILRIVYFVIFVSVLLFTMIVFFSGVIANFFNQPLITVYLPWLAITIVLLGTSQIFISVLQRFFLFRDIAICEIFSNALGLATTVCMANLGYGTWSLVYGIIVTGFTRLVTGAITFFRTVKKIPRNSSEIKYNKMKEFALFQTGERVIDYLSQNTDKAIIGKLLGSHGLGIYGIATQISRKPIQVIVPAVMRISQSWLVNFRDDNVKLAQEYFKVIKLLVIIMFPIYLTVSICSPLIVNTLLGENWNEVAPVLYIASIQGVLFSLGSPIVGLGLATGKPKYTFYLNVVSIITYSIAFLIGVQYSTVGVALASFLVSLLILFPLEFYIRYKLAGIKPSDYFSELFHLIMAIVIPMSFHAFLLFFTDLLNNFRNQIFYATCSVSFFYIYSWIHERDILCTLKRILFIKNNVQ